MLSTHIPIGIGIACGSTDEYNPQNCTQTAVTISWRNMQEQKDYGPYSYQALRDGTPISSCATRSTSCTDSDVPAGTHYYTVYSIDPNNVASPASAAAQADVP